MSPMLATHYVPSAASFPLAATPKLDGIRCLKIAGRAVTRSLRPIPNRHIRKWIERHMPDGIDGEIIAGTFAKTSSAVAKRDGTPEFTFHAFDFVADANEPYTARMARLAALPHAPGMVKVLPMRITCQAELAAYERICLAAGHEGVMLRQPDAGYISGRSDALMKLKRFADSEATITGTFEATTAGRRNGTLGGFIARTAAGIQFRLKYSRQHGLAAASELWQRRASLIGRMVKFQHQPSGAGAAPRFPVFIGFREAFDV